MVVDAVFDVPVWVTVIVEAFCDAQLVGEEGFERVEHVDAEMVTVKGGGQ